MLSAADFVVSELPTGLLLKGAIVLSGFEVTAIVPTANTPAIVSDNTAVLLAAMAAREAGTPTLTAFDITATFAAAASLGAVIFPNRTKAISSEPFPKPRRESCFFRDFFAR